MDLQTRKIEFVKEFLTIDSEATISKLEKVMHNYDDLDEGHFKPMTVAELNRRIDKAEDDYENGRFKSSEEIIAKYK